MRSLAVVLLGALIFAAAAAFFAPASLVDQRVALASEGRARIAGATGTVWHGRGVLVDPRGHGRLPIEWRLDAGALIRGVVDISLLRERDKSEPRGQLRLAGERVEARDFDVTIPAAAVANFFSGQLRITSDAIAVEHGRASGSLSIEWRHASVEPIPQQVFDLGTVNVRMMDGGSGMTGTIEARGGQILANGTVALTAQNVVLDAELAPSPTATDSVRQALAMLGNVDARGAVRVSLSRDLR